jgi:hypothetical protein
MKITKNQLRKIIKEEIQNTLREYPKSDDISKLFEILDPDDIKKLRASAKLGPKELKKVYRELAKRYHPDVSVYDTDEANLDMSEVSELYNALKDDPRSEWTPPKRSSKETSDCRPGDKYNMKTGAKCPDFTDCRPGDKYNMRTGARCPDNERPVAENFKRWGELIK